MYYILRLYSDNTGLCESVRRFVLIHLVCAQRYFCSFHSCLDRNELLRHVRRVACDILITSGMIVRNFNDSVLNEHIESIMFCEFNSEDEGKVTSMDKRRCLICVFTMLFNDCQMLNCMVLHAMQRDIKKLVYY